MNNFSVKRLQDWLRVTAGEAKQIRRAIELVGTEQYDRYGLSIPDTSQVDAVLELVNELTHAHGVEAIRGPYVDRFYFDINALYVNMGDTYTGTMLYDTEKERLYLTTWGDWCETHEKRCA